MRLWTLIAAVLVLVVLPVGATSPACVSIGSTAYTLSDNNVSLCLPATNATSLLAVYSIGASDFYVVVSDPSVVPLVGYPVSGVPYVVFPAIAVSTAFTIIYTYPPDAQGTFLELFAVYDNLQPGNSLQLACTPITGMLFLLNSTAYDVFSINVIGSSRYWVQICTAVITSYEDVAEMMTGGISQTCIGGGFLPQRAFASTGGSISAGFSFISPCNGTGPITVTFERLGSTAGVVSSAVKLPMSVQPTLQPVSPGTAALSPFFQTFWTVDAAITASPTDPVVFQVGISSAHVQTLTLSVSPLAQVLNGTSVFVLRSNSMLPSGSPFIALSYGDFAGNGPWLVIATGSLTSTPSAIVWLTATLVPVIIPDNAGYGAVVGTSSTFLCSFVAVNSTAALVSSTSVQAQLIAGAGANGVTMFVAQTGFNPFNFTSTASSNQVSFLPADRTTTFALCPQVSSPVTEAASFYLRFLPGSNAVTFGNALSSSLLEFDVELDFSGLSLILGTWAVSSLPSGQQSSFYFNVLFPVNETWTVQYSVISQAGASLSSGSLSSAQATTVPTIVVLPAMSVSIHWTVSLSTTVDVLLSSVAQMTLLSIDPLVSGTVPTVGFTLNLTSACVDFNSPNLFGMIPLQFSLVAKGDAIVTFFSAQTGDLTVQPVQLLAGVPLVLPYVFDSTLTDFSSDIIMCMTERTVMRLPLSINVSTPVFPSFTAVGETVQILPLVAGVPLMGSVTSTGGFGFYAKVSNADQSQCVGASFGEWPLSAQRCGSFSAFTVQNALTQLTPVLCSNPSLSYTFYYAQCLDSSLPTGAPCGNVTILTLTRPPPPAQPDLPAVRTAVCSVHNPAPAFIRSLGRNGEISLYTPLASSLGCSFYVPFLEQVVYRNGSSIAGAEIPAVTFAASAMFAAFGQVYSGSALRVYPFVGPDAGRINTDVYVDYYPVPGSPQCYPNAAIILAAAENYVVFNLRLQTLKFAYVDLANMLIVDDLEVWGCLAACPAGDNSAFVAVAASGQYTAALTYSFTDATAQSVAGVYLSGLRRSAYAVFVDPMAIPIANSTSASSSPSVSVCQSGIAAALVGNRVTLVNITAGQQVGTVVVGTQMPTVTNPGSVSLSPSCRWLVVSVPGTLVVYSSGSGSGANIGGGFRLAWSGPLPAPFLQQTTQSLPSQILSALAFDDFEFANQLDLLVTGLDSAGVQTFAVLLPPTQTGFQALPTGVSSPCPPGFSKNSTAVFPCTPCAPSTFQLQSGRSRCVAVPAGYASGLAASRAVAGNYTTLRLNQPFAAQFSSDTGEEVLTKALFLPPAGQESLPAPYFAVIGATVAMAVLLLLLCLPVTLYPMSVHNAVSAASAFMQQRDRAKQKLFDATTMRIVDQGTVLGGALAVWSYMVIFIGIAFATWYSQSYLLCPTIRTLDADTAFGLTGTSLYPAYGSMSSNTDTVSTDALACPSTEVRNILRQLQVLPFAAVDNDIVDMITYMQSDLPINVTLLLLGYSDLRPPATVGVTSSQDSICQDATITSTGCSLLDAAQTTCAIAMGDSCIWSIQADGIGVLTYSVPIQHQLSSAATFSVQLPQYIVANAVTLLVSTAGNQTITGREFTTIPSWVRLVAVPLSSGMLCSAQFSTSLLYVARTTENPNLSGANIFTGYVTFQELAPLLRPCSAGATAGTFSTSVVLTLAGRDFFLSQSEQRKLPLTELLFTMSLAIIALYELTEFVIHVVHIVSHKLQHRFGIGHSTHHAGSGAGSRESKGGTPPHTPPASPKLRASTVGLARPLLLHDPIHDNHL